MSTEQVFSSEHELNSFIDVLNEVRLLVRKPSINYTAEECVVFFNLLPKSVKDIALSWGISDTEFRDAAYVHFKTHCLDRFDKELAMKFKNGDRAKIEKTESELDGEVVIITGVGMVDAPTQQAFYVVEKVLGGTFTTSTGEWKSLVITQHCLSVHN